MSSIKGNIYADGWACEICGGSVIAPFEVDVDVTTLADDFPQRLLVKRCTCAYCGANVPEDIAQWHLSQDERLLSVEECLQILSRRIPGSEVG